MEKKLDFKKYVREVEDFPRDGIRFYDVAPLVGNGAVFAAAIREMAVPLRGNVDKVVGFDARGFLFGSAVALELGVGFAMLRKAGKLPGEVESTAYALEYGNDGLELQTEAVSEGERVALVDDVIATGGTALAGIELVRRRGARIIEFTGLIDLPLLGGSKAITAEGVPVRTLMSFGGEE